MASPARLSVESIVNLHRATVVDVASYQSACKAIESLVKSGQVIEADAEAAKAQLLTHAFSVVAKNAASKPAGRITVVARRLDTMYDDNSSDAAKKEGRKVAGKGNVCVYGLQRFPLALYPSQWERLFALADEVRKVIADNADSLDNSK